jgi:hypothetical protein
MASLIAAGIGQEPNDSPTWTVGLTYLASVLIGAGALLSVQSGSQGYPFSGDVFGLTGGDLVILGSLGFIGALVIVSLGIYGWWRPRLARGSGETIIILSLLSLVTSYYGLFFIGTLVGVISGIQTIRATPRKETPPPDWRHDKPPPLPDWKNPK